MSEPAIKGGVFDYEVLIRESLIDTLGHMNNAKYLELFEEARWEIITPRGFSVGEIMKNRIGPVILEVNLRFMKEVRLRQKIRIRSEVETMSATSKTMTMKQTMLGENGESYCEARFVFGLFDLKLRKLILPTPEWLRAVGLET